MRDDRGAEVGLSIRLSDPQQDPATPWHDGACRLFLPKSGKVAVLDVDFHHGNGTQDIFWRRSDVLTVSIHGHPSFAYPYFTGFADEIGEDEGRGFNLNLPLPEKTSIEKYLAALRRSLGRIRKHDPAYLVIAPGLNTAAGDPTGTWNLRSDNFAEIGR